MPVGWAPPPDQQWDQRFSSPPGPSLDEVWPPIALVALFLALVLLMPNFDGSRGADWGDQEEDRK